MTERPRVPTRSGTSDVFTADIAMDAVVHCVKQ